MCLNGRVRFVISYCWDILSPNASTISARLLPLGRSSKSRSSVTELAVAFNSSNFPGWRSDFTSCAISSVTSAFGLNKLLIRVGSEQAYFCKLSESCSNLAIRSVCLFSKFINSCDSALISWCCSLTFDSSLTRAVPSSTKRFSH